MGVVVRLVGRLGAFRLSATGAITAAPGPEFTLKSPVLGTLGPLTRLVLVAIAEGACALAITRRATAAIATTPTSATTAAAVAVTPATAPKTAATSAGTGTEPPPTSPTTTPPPAIRPPAPPTTAPATEAATTAATTAMARSGLADSSRSPCPWA